jgi:hypothetical protein
MVNSMMLAARIRSARLFVAPAEGHLLLMDDDSAALPTIRDFLKAEPLQTGDAWGAARSVDQTAVDRAMRANGWGPPPWSVVSAAFRWAYDPAKGAR